MRRKSSENPERLGIGGELTGLFDDIIFSNFHYSDDF